MTLASRWRNKLRRRFYSPYNKIVHRGRYFICQYFGADFLVRSVNVGGLEISAKIAEHAELTNFTRGAAALKPDVFIDIGANLGLYTCIVMKNRLAPRAIAFEPDRRNRVHLQGQSADQRPARRRCANPPRGARRRTGAATPSAGTRTRYRPLTDRRDRRGKGRLRGPRLRGRCRPF